MTGAVIDIRHARASRAAAVLRNILTPMEAGEITAAYAHMVSVRAASRMAESERRFHEIEAHGWLCRHCGRMHAPGDTTCMAPSPLTVVAT